jgi:alkylation response protein AidB-like acyl-CoA dehydrogenase
MKFAFSPQQEALRQEVRQFIAEHVTPEVLAEQEGREEDDPRIQGPHTEALLEKMAERGWIRLAMPTEYGGQGGDLADQYIVDEEFNRAGIFIGHNYGTGYTTILQHGTQEQKDYFIPRMIRGEVRLGLGYTEPSGGTDLAGLKSVAVRDGDDWIINGQKMYGASPTQTHMYMLVRTDPTVEKHKGLSIFLVPMDAPGVTVRPIKLLKDRSRSFAYTGAWAGEAFFDDVRVPASAILGQPGDGWMLATSGLAIDRIGITRYLRCTFRTDHMVDYLQDAKLGDYEPRLDPLVRDSVAKMWIERQMYRLMTMRSLQMVRQNMRIVHESPAEKVWGPDSNVRAIEGIAQILGPYMQLLEGEEAPRGGEFGDHLLSGWFVGIGHGSTHAMRDQIARRGLGLPRG